MGLWLLIQFLGMFKEDGLGLWFVRKNEARGSNIF